MTPIGEEIWIVDGAEISFFGMFRLPTRMVIVRLGSDLWVHSPVELTPSIPAEIDALGELRHIVAPNDYHHLYLLQWMERWPDAKVFGTSGLAAKRPDVKFDAFLEDGPRAEWGDVLDCVIFAGNRLMDEAIFFHRPSQTAILTDLILNVPVDDYSWPARLFARFDGVAHPHGGTPRLFRWSMQTRERAKAAVEKLLAWEPQRAVLAHGEYITEDAAAQLRLSFAWLDD